MDDRTSRDTGAHKNPFTHPHRHERRIAATNARGPPTETHCNVDHIKIAHIQINPRTGQGDEAVFPGATKKTSESGQTNAAMPTPKTSPTWEDHQQGGCPRKRDSGQQQEASPTTEERWRPEAEESAKQAFSECRQASKHASIFCLLFCGVVDFAHSRLAIGQRAAAPGTCSRKCRISQPQNPLELMIGATSTRTRALWDGWNIATAAAAVHRDRPITQDGEPTRLRQGTLPSRDTLRGGTISSERAGLNESIGPPEYCKPGLPRCGRGKRRPPNMERELTLRHTHVSARRFS